MTSTYVSQEKIQEKNVRWLVSHELFSTKYKLPDHEIKGPEFSFLDKRWQLELCLKTNGNYFESTTIRLGTDCKCDADIRLEVTTIMPTWVKVLWFSLLGLLAWWMSRYTNRIYLSIFAVVSLCTYRATHKKRMSMPEPGPGGYLWDLDTSICKLSWGCIFYWGVIYITTLGNQWCGNMQSRALGLTVAIYIGFGQATQTWVEKMVRFKGLENRARTVWKMWLGYTWYLRMTASPEHEIRLRIRVRSCETTGVFPRKRVYTCEHIVRNMVNTEECTDVILRTMEGEEIKAQSTFLTYHSEVFRNMLSPGSFNEGINGLVNLEDVESDHVRALLDFCYFGNISKDLVCELFKLADKYLIESLREGCFDIMKSEKNPATAISYIQTLRGFRNNMDCKETAMELLALIRSTDIKTAFVRETMSTWSDVPLNNEGAEPL